jgi:predicted ArsR family transcriptional regulator
MPEIRENEDAITVRECNCPFPESVKRTRIPCQLEKRFFEAIFQADLDRVSYIPDGNPACTYEVSRDKVALTAPES